MPYRSNNQMRKATCTSYLDAPNSTASEFISLRSQADTDYVFDPVVLNQHLQKLCESRDFHRGCV